jgi:hypothetical protein
MNAAIILQLILQYGPSAVTAISDLVAKLEAGGALTVADVEAEFAGLKPYSAYSIRLVVPPVAATKDTAAAQG